MTTTLTQAFLNAQNAQRAFLTLTHRTVPVPPTQVFAAQRLIAQTQTAIRAAFRNS